MPGSCRRGGPPRTTLVRCIPRASGGGGGHDLAQGDLVGAHLDVTATGADQHAVRTRGEQLSEHVAEAALGQPSSHHDAHADRPRGPWRAHCGPYVAPLLTWGILGPVRRTVPPRTRLPGGTARDVCDRPAVRGREGQGVHRGVPRRLHLRGRAMLYIHPDECVDCGACEPVCPVEAIYYEDDVPDQWTRVLQGQRRVLRRARLARRRRQGRRDRQGPPDHRGAPAAAARRVTRRPMGAADRRAAGLPVGHARAVRRARPRAPGRHRRPLGRHPRRPDARGWSRAGPGRRGRTRPATRRRTGTPALREAIVDWFARRRGVPGLDPAAVLPTIGSKELVALPAVLLGPRRRATSCVHPRDRLPDVRRRRAARRARRRCRATTPTPTGPRHDVRLVWLNSPSQPRPARCSTPSICAAVVDAARALGACVASDECYARTGAGTSRGRRPAVPSILDPRVCGRRPHAGLLAVLLAVQAVEPRRLPRGLRRGRPGDRRAAARGPQARGAHGARARAGRDDRRARRRRARRRAAATATAGVAAALRPALERAGFASTQSTAGLYLWAAAGGAARTAGATVADLAELGILVAPGTFYGRRRAARAGRADGVATSGSADGGRCDSRVRDRRDSRPIRCVTLA